MGKKSRAKKTRRQNQSEIMKWEDLDALKNEAVQSMITSQNVISMLFEQYGNVPKGESQTPEQKKVTESVLGFMKTFQDIVPRIAKVMEQHSDEVITKEDGSREYKFKKGVVKQDSDDPFTYINIANQYQEICESISDISAVGFTDLFTQIRTIDNSITDEDIQKIAEVNNEGKMNVLKQQIAVAARMPGGEKVLQQVEEALKGEINGEQ